MKFIGLSLLTGFIVCLQSASATLNVNYYENTAAGAYMSDIQTTDLVNQGQSTFGTLTSDKTPDNSFPVTGLNNGYGGLSQSGTNGNNETFYNTPSWPVKITFNLNIGVNTAGYDITQVQTIAGWTNNFSNQSFTLWVEAVGSSTFTQVGGTITDLSWVSTDFSQKIVATDSSGTIATGIQAVQLYYSSASPSPLVIQEIDINGTPSVIPEPSSCALLAIGAMFLARRRRA